MKTCIFAYVKQIIVVVTTVVGCAGGVCVRRAVPPRRVDTAHALKPARDAGSMMADVWTDF